MAEYRVDELARAADTSVRNVRVYQDRGLLPPPRKVGRNGIYTDAHLARLRLIRVLLHRGYTFATIGELIGALTQGQDITELIGLDDAIAVPWSDETPTRVDETTLAEGFGASADQIERARRLGIFGHDGDDETSLLAFSPKILEAGAELLSSGVPLAAILDLAEELQTQMDGVARTLFRTVQGVFDGADGRPDAAKVEALLRLRPFATQAVSAFLALSMNKEAESLLERRAKRGARGDATVRPDLTAAEASPVATDA